MVGRAQQPNEVLVAALPHGTGAAEPLHKHVEQP